MIAVLAALSVPAYQNHILRSNRALAKTTLIELASQQEAYALQHNAYATNLSTLLGNNQANINNFFLSRDGKKAKTLNSDSSSIYEFELLDTTATSFNLRAHAVGSQLHDQNCQSLTVNSKGQRTAIAHRGGDFSACWR